MNWGKKILLIYVAFVLLVLVMVYFSMNQKVELVAPDYYAQELAFQNKIDARRNNANEGLSWNIVQTTNSVAIIFPDSVLAQSMKGSVLFFRASDADYDVKETIKLDAGGQQSIQLSKFIKGAYIVKIDWTIEGKNYFEQRNFFLY